MARRIILKQCGNNFARVMCFPLLWLISACTLNNSLPPPAISPDTSWVRSSSVLYGAYLEYGVFRLPLNGGRPIPIGDHSGMTPVDFRMSRNHKKLLYALADAAQEGYWIYDIPSKTEIDLSAEISSWSSVYPSPNWRQVAWYNVRTPEVFVVSTGTLKRRSFSLPQDSAQKEFIFSIAWSNNGKFLLIGRSRLGGTETYLVLNPATGYAESVRGIRERVSTDLADQIHYILMELILAIAASCAAQDKQVPISVYQTVVWFSSPAVANWTFGDRMAVSSLCKRQYHHRLHLHPALRSVTADQKEPRPDCLECSMATMSSTSLADDTGFMVSEKIARQFYRFRPGRLWSSDAAVA